MQDEARYGTARLRRTICTLAFSFGATWAVVSTASAQLKATDSSGNAASVPPSVSAPAVPSAPSAASGPPSAPTFALVDAGWDRPLRVLPSPDNPRRPLIYLHGYCGDVNAALSFADAASEHGTLIALLGDQPCKDKPGRFKWSRDIRGLDARIRRAIQLVGRALAIDFSRQDITLVGYSQGALRAESLSRYYGKHYPRVLLGGPPQRADPKHFPQARAIAIFGGEKEDTQDMSGGASDLQAAGKTAPFFLARRRSRRLRRGRQSRRGRRFALRVD
jgi:predicted esterase